MKNHEQGSVPRLTRWIERMTRRGHDRSGVTGALALDLLARSEWQGQEQSRRARVLSELYRRHAVETAGETGTIAYRDSMPPDAWVNGQLARRGEVWRVQIGRAHV